MSLFFGIFNTNQQPASAQLLEEMYGGVAHFPHERKAFMVRSNAAFGHVLTHNTPEAVYEQMPAYVADAQLLFVAQGRLDNRAELAAALGVRLHEKLPDGQLPDGQLPDGELMLKAYQKWGDNVPARLLGDWSLAAWDLRGQEFFLACDHHGYTSLFYHFEQGQFAFGSSIKSLLALNSIPKAVNISKIIYDYALVDAANHETAHKGIFWLPPAHTLKVKNGQVELKRHWFPENIEPIYRKNPQDYAEELRHILTKAVRARLRSHKPVASMLSGGLDSSTVSFLAAELLSKQGIRLPTFSHVPLFKEELKAQKQTNQVLDESPFMAATVQASGYIDPTYLSSSHFTPTTGFLKILDCHDALIHGAGNAYWLVDIMETAQRQGFGTLLTGEHGNSGISFTGVDYLLPLTHPIFIENPKRLIKSRILKPLALQYVPWLLARRTNSIEDYIKNTLYLRKNVVAEWQLLEEIKKNNGGFDRYYPDAKAGMLHILGAGSNPRCMFGSNAGHYYGVEKRDPTADKRVLEYCLSIPNDAFFDHQGSNKQVLKRMMKNRLPDQVLFEKRKGLQSADLAHRALAERETITNLLDKMSQNDAFNDLMDTQKLKANWQNMSAAQNAAALYPQTILKTLMVGCFLNKY